MIFLEIQQAPVRGASASVRPDAWISKADALPSLISWSVGLVDPAVVRSDIGWRIAEDGLVERPENLTLQSRQGLRFFDGLKDDLRVGHQHERVASELAGLHRGLLGWMSPL
jgi:hypothetical protein